ncbi:MAG: DUF4842 domain-containing protein [Bacteroidales bacterium]|nr:DUF4842 domain-containing protein [Bacteroidales bacterium]
MKKVFSKIFMLSVGALAFTACADEYNPGAVTKEDLLKENYAKHWEDVFGTPDPNQDWSMATPVVANVSIGNKPSVVIYSGKPGYAGTTVLGIVNGSSAKFNAIKGLEQVYAIVTENGKTLISGFYDVANGTVTINEKPVAKRVAMTRAADDPELGARLFTHVAWDAAASWDGKTYYWNPWKNDSDPGFIQVKQEGEEWFLYFTLDLNTSFRKLKHNSTFDYSVCGYDSGDLYYADGDEEKALSCGYMGNYLEKDSETGGIKPKGPRVEIKQHYDAPYYRISGDTKTTPSEWVIGDCKTLFWEGDACFVESEDFRSTRKKAVYESYGSSIEKLQQGVEFTTVRDNQNINIPMMYGVTVKSNVFGYYYYKDGQDRRSVNRYVLFDDASPSANLKIGDHVVGGQELASQGSYADTDVVTCVTRRLVYFGEDGNGIDGNGAGTYDFPKDVHIGFFIMKKYANGDDWSGLTGSTALESWAYSTASLNKLYFNDGAGPNSTLQQFWGYRYGLDTSVPHDYGTPAEQGNVVAGCDGRVKAITWKYNGRILVGFGDDSGDEDLNDFVFWYDGEVPPEEEPDINITTDELESSWILACEDLGGTFDYDFNDVVLEVAQKYEDVYTDGVKTGTNYGNVEIRLLAAGGTLPANVVYGSDESDEIHELIGQPKDQSVYTADVTPHKVVLFTIPMTTQVDLSTLCSSIKIKVNRADGTVYVTNPSANAPYDKGGDATPQIIILPGEWEWPTEGTPINEAYPEFINWTNDATWTQWSANKASGKTVSR